MFSPAAGRTAPVSGTACATVAVRAGAPVFAVVRSGAGGVVGAGAAAGERAAVSGRGGCSPACASPRGGAVCDACCACRVRSARRCSNADDRLCPVWRDSGRASEPSGIRVLAAALSCGRAASGNGVTPDGPTTSAGTLPVVVTCGVCVDRVVSGAMTSWRRSTESALTISTDIECPEESSSAPDLRLNMSGSIGRPANSTPIMLPCRNMEISVPRHIIRGRSGVLPLEKVAARQLRRAG